MNTDTKGIVKYGNKIPKGYVVQYTQSGTKLVKDTRTQTKVSLWQKLINGKQSGQAGIVFIIVLAAIVLFLLASGTLDWLVNSAGICEGVLCNM